MLPQLRRLLNKYARTFRIILDILIHNAGIGIRGSIENITLSQWQQGLESNFTAVFHLTQALLPVIPSGGSIITIGSSIVAHPLPNMAAYGAGKAGSAYFTQVLAQELGPRGIRANIVLQGVLILDLGDRVRSFQTANSLEDGLTSHWTTR